MSRPRGPRPHTVQPVRLAGRPAALCGTPGAVHAQGATQPDLPADTPWSAPDPRGHRWLLRPDRPASARLASLMLAGKDHLAADRMLLDRLQSEDAHCLVRARRGREFLHHAAGHLAERGLDQFLDLGCGLTTGAPGTALAPIHTSVLTARPGARVVYLDRDPVVMAHARALLDAPAPAQVRHLRADLATPGALLAKLREHAGLEWRRPVAAVLGDVLHELSDPQARCLLAALRRELPAGSVLVLSHRTAVAGAPGRAARVAACWEQADLPWYPRTPEAVDALLDGWERQELGVESVAGEAASGVYAVVAVSSSGGRGR
ncbi:SAM-dependent methyltransferase [Streptomyces sp. BE303]|uniref:SAM-dependent methyltransferase n=1 Tax=Streptomyces sp. BE303 TaxID=3002528 RepID=UPI002E78BAE5|nr:SAM-dependent methyltransferase [Streptomyces sp. BE303]MED7950202.1 SAM-dependent methyltransferase [Streptomyces sp. BE303]